MEHEKQHALEPEDIRERPIEYGPNVRPFPDYDDRKLVWDYLSHQYGNEWKGMAPDKKQKLLENTIHSTVEAIRKNGPGVWESLLGQPQQRRELFFAQFVERNAPRTERAEQYEQFQKMQEALNRELGEKADGTTDATGLSPSVQEPVASAPPIEQESSTPPPFGAWAFQNKKPLTAGSLKEYKKTFGIT